MESAMFMRRTIREEKGMRQQKSCILLGKIVDWNKEMDLIRAEFGQDLQDIKDRILSILWSCQRFRVEAEALLASLLCVRCLWFWLG